MSETMFYILFSLLQERYGYGIMQHVKLITHDRIILGASTVYSTLLKLEKAGFITPTVQRDRQKYYVITNEGRFALQEEFSRVEEVYNNAKGMLCENT